MYTNNNRNLLILAVLFFLGTFIATTHSIAVQNLRIENPKPDGSGTVVFQLKADPADSDVGSLSGFTITSTNFVNAAQSLRLYNSVAGDCSGTLLTTTGPNNVVPSTGMVCFLSNVTFGSAAEFQNSFTYAATGGSNAAPDGSVTVINYNRQTCKSIPDLGGSGSFKAPPRPTVSITLSGLQIKFSVTATYLRNQSSWFLDFFNFNNAANGDSADGTGRNCANHKPSNYPASFANWWYSGVRADYTSSIDSSIQDAIDSSIYPNYKTAGTRWTTTVIDCSTIKYETTIPVSQLIGNDSSTDCYQVGNGLPAATTTGNLRYTGTLYVNALRPLDASSASGGYFKSVFAYPFTFNLQTTVSDIVSSSSKWNFAVGVVNSQVTYTGSTPSFTMDLRTTISSATLDSPNVVDSAFVLASYPFNGLRGGLSGETPTLTRLGDNNNCDASTRSPCVITWRMVMPQLSLAQLSGSQPNFDAQYSGKYAFQWTTTTSDLLVSDIYVDVSAVDPSTNLTQVPVTSSVKFFVNKATMQDTTNNGLTVPQFSSGEQIWVRHSFLVDSNDIQAFIFTLKSAYLCFSSVPGFTPSLSSGRTGCSVDIPGVMEAANGERFVLFDRDSLSSGIADIAATQPGQQSKIWGWTQVLPADLSWTGLSTVNNGFGINAQPLAVDGIARTYYFHLISTVAQTPLGRRRSAEDSSEEVEMHHLVRVENQSGSDVQSVTIMASSPSSAAGSAPFISALKEMLY